MHKVTGVFGLPQQLIYALTGTLMALLPLLFELSIGPVFGGDSLRAVRTAGALVEDPPPRDYGPATAPLPLDAILARALAAEPRLEPESFIVRGYQRQEGTVDIRGHVQGIAFGDGLVRVRARDGVIELVETPDRESAVGAVARWMHGLHTVEYGGMTARFMIFVLGMFGCITILSGNWVWLERRRARADTLGNQLLARATAGVGAGAIVALGALFLGSRLLPLDLPGRTVVEELWMAGAFAASLTYALATRSSLATWWRLLGVGSLAFLALPIAARAHLQAGLFGSGPHDPVVVLVDAGFATFGAILFAVALLLARIEHRRQREPKPVLNALELSHD